MLSMLYCGCTKQYDYHKPTVCHLVGTGADLSTPFPQGKNSPLRWDLEARVAMALTG